MPTIFQGICSNCGHKTPLMLPGYYAVAVDEPVREPQAEAAAAVVFSGADGPIAETNDPRFVVLRHPMEDQDLATTGYSWTGLLIEGRHVSVTNVVCGQCGTVFPRRRLTVPFLVGCLPSVMLATVLGAGIGVWEKSFFAGFLGWYCGVLGILIVVHSVAFLYFRARFSLRAASLAAERSCPECDADNAKPIHGAKSVMCPSCRRESMSFFAVGHS